ncbi:anaphase-promoting complex subunit 4 [Protobothrops mucrosquamatus]|uniref:anaphase-promoting complex subunit 4 n=1 Tax=Protobothrops mucrosquamatus TaxID=103944 RepID=UPI0010FADA15|nr:anaphase-promoting complex subunit 4 [Protobothrops mucrosquamatus]
MQEMVLLHRLANFQRVWSLPPNESTGKEVSALAWRPDGKILAFGLADTKKVILCDVEKPESLHSFSVSVPLTFMYWMEVTEENSVLISFYNAEDESSLLLPKLPPLPKNYSTTAKIFSEEKSDEIMKLMGDVRLNALVLGGVNGFIEIYAYGMYKIATITGVRGSCLALCLSSDLKSLSVVTEVDTGPDGDPEITYFQVSGRAGGSEALLYHLSELKGMALWKQKYESLGLDASGIEDAITAVGSFILKANELLQVIDSSMKNFKAFFRWLYYLKDEDDDLVSPPNTDGNQWFNFLQNSNSLKESPLLFPYYPQKSLHFVKRRMEAIIDQCLQKPADVIGKTVHQAFCMPLYRASKSEDSTPQLLKLPFLWHDKSYNLHYVLFTMLENSVSKLYILRRHTDISRSTNNGLLAVEFGNFLNKSVNESKEASSYSCLDAHFYDNETITVILVENSEQEGKERLLAQLPLSSICREQNQGMEFNWNSGQRLDLQRDGIPTCTVTAETQCRVLENMKAHYVTVNGIRKVSCVLSSNLRHIRVFEMDEDDGEAEEEEDEEGPQAVGLPQEELNQSTDTVEGE